MGMYDYVKYKAKCWRCGGEIKSFQTKDSNCNMDTILPKKLGNNSRFYEMCPVCGAWNEYKVITKEVEIVFDKVESKLNTNRDLRKER